MNHAEVAAVLTKERRDRLETELLEIEGRVGELMKSNKPVRYEIERLGKRKIAILRLLGMM